MAGAGILGARVTPAAAQQVKYSSGTEPPRLKVPANACDCHHHIYGSQYKVDPRSTLRPGDATVENDRALQKRIGTGRNVIVQPSTYGTRMPQRLTRSSRSAQPHARSWWSTPRSLMPS
jgi:D-galactarolactone isomerase